MRKKKVTQRNKHGDRPSTIDDLCPTFIRKAWRNLGQNSSKKSGFGRIIINISGQNCILQDAQYRLSDEFSLFHCTWIAPLGKRMPENGYWIKQRQSPRWRAWSGYACEGICLKHARQIKAALGISGVQTTKAPWRHHPATDESGTQIDLLIDRADDTINLCEMKFSEGVFTIDKRYADILRHKRDTFRRVTGTRKNLFITMVTPYGVADNPYAKELVASRVEVETLFRI